MITIGLTTFSDHPALIDGASRKVRLTEYSGHFPIVELDTPFYALPTVETVKGWQQQVPAEFQFILKANRLMTLHDQVVGEPATGSERQQMFKDYRKMIAPLIAAGQLTGVLFQFPPSFRRRVESFNYLQRIRHWLPEVPILVELRDPSWYANGIGVDVVQLVNELGMSLVVVDEPHTANLGVPLLELTNPELTMVRLHGRNLTGWAKTGKEARSVRTLYDYSTEELGQLAQTIQNFAEHSKQVVVIFNNNAGHAAAGNALTLQKILNLHFDNLSPTQLDLF